MKSDTERTNSNQSQFTIYITFKEPPPFDCTSTA